MQENKFTNTNIKENEKIYDFLKYAKPSDKVKPV